jgi:hypothetical protein
VRRVDIRMSFVQAEGDVFGVIPIESGHNPSY